MQTNPYAPTAPLEYHPGFTSPIGSFEAVRNATEAEFNRRGFACLANVKVGPYVALLRCTKHGRHLPIWYTDRTYIHELDGTTEPSISLMHDIHAHNVADAETFHHPWPRLRIPTTATYILHHRPISDESKELVRSTRLPKQSNRAHAFFLLNLAIGETCFHIQNALIKSVNIQRATQTFEWYVGILHEIAAEQ